MQLVLALQEIGRRREQCINAAHVSCTTDLTLEWDNRWQGPRQFEEFWLVVHDDVDTRNEPYDCTYVHIMYRYVHMYVTVTRPKIIISILVMRRPDFIPYATPSGSLRLQVTPHFVVPM